MGRLLSRNSGPAEFSGHGSLTLRHGESKCLIHGNWGYEPPKIDPAVYFHIHRYCDKISPIIGSSVP